MIQERFTNSSRSFTRSKGRKWWWRWLLICDIRQWWLLISYIRFIYNIEKIRNKIDINLNLLCLIFRFAVFLIMSSRFSLDLFLFQVLNSKCSTYSTPDIVKVHIGDHMPITIKCCHNINYHHYTSFRHIPNRHR